MSRALRGMTAAERRIQRASVDDPEIVLNAAARFLETRARSVAEVRRRLTFTGYRPELVAGAIDRLVELGMLDDEAFARAWIESRDRARPRGEQALRRELVLKGIDRVVIDGLLEERREATAADGKSPEGGPDGGPDQLAAERLLARHARTLERIPDPRARRRRAYALLARNGFDPETCARVARHIAEPADPAD